MVTAILARSARYSDRDPGGQHFPILDLDDPATRAAVEADPITFVSGPGPVFIDEYQHVPMILDAIKAELNRDGSPGRFVISGSTRHDALPHAAQALSLRLNLRRPS